MTTLSTSEHLKTQQISAPCSMIFKKWALFKSMWAAPLVSLGIATLIGLVYYLLRNYLSHAWISFFTAMGFCFLCATGGTLLVLPVFIPYCFLRQTTTPSFMQKAIRFYCCNIMGWGNPIGIPRHETVSFEYWLSHPGQAWPEDIKIWGDYLDTTSFDWQNPDEWETPMQKAQEQASHQGLDNAPVIENLVIGSQAQETAQKIEEHPVKHITTLFQAILNQNVSTLQKLLPTGELNRPFAGTGNTPLHVAVLNGYTDIVRLLLTQPGIDTTRTNNEEKTALDLAREKGFIEIIQLLENKHD